MALNRNSSIVKTHLFFKKKKGGYVFRALCGISSRRYAFSKCRELGGEWVCSFNLIRNPKKLNVSFFLAHYVAL